MERYIPTGNEMISLPKINEYTGGIEAISFLSMSQKGMVELRGNLSMPLIIPFVQMLTGDGDFKELPLTDLHWSREFYWIPKLTAKAGFAEIVLTILTPINERGFAIRLSVSASQDADIRLGLRGCWESVWHCVNEEKFLNGRMNCYESAWTNGIVFDFSFSGPMFSFAPMADKPCESEYSLSDGAITYSVSRTETLTTQDVQEITFFWGLGFEEVAAATSAKEMFRRTWAWEYEKTILWLKNRCANMANEKATEIYNTNLFFCIFYSTGITMDTEELVCVTSRSSRYYVSAAYWDRDTLLWSFPAILDVDPKLAKQMLEYVFTRQQRNFGIHSRYIDGTVLEPGIELDELVAPILALSSYVEQTGDIDLLHERYMVERIKNILSTLSSVKHPKTALYETFLQPTDDEIVYPYITYDNVLVWRAFTELAKLMPETFPECSRKAEEIRNAVYQNCIFYDDDDKPYFAWSIDLAGNHDVYDEPPGSLQLLPYYGFCKQTDFVWENTVNMIRSSSYAYSFADKPIAEIGCPHAPYPWVLSFCNSFLCGYEQQAWNELLILEMDNGIACESVDAVSGVCTTGAAFATCAGFLCHSMKVVTDRNSKAMV